MTESKMNAYLAAFPEVKSHVHFDQLIWNAKLTEEGERYVQCKEVIEKMSKSKYNVVNPDEVIAQYGADCFRMYEMFLGPITDSKPWDTKGIEGVSRFLRKLWNLFYNEKGEWAVTTAEPSKEENKALHKMLKKVEEDIVRLSFNTCVSSFMICVNELGALKCRKRSILEPLIVAICPFAPFTTEELWKQLGNSGTITYATFPITDESVLVENSFSYPIAFNGKLKLNMEFALDADPANIEKAVLANEAVQKHLNGNAPKKFIFVKGKMINMVV